MSRICFYISDFTEDLKDINSNILFIAYWNEHFLKNKSFIAYNKNITGNILFNDFKSQGFTMCSFNSKYDLDSIMLNENIKVFFVLINGNKNIPEYYPTIVPNCVYTDSKNSIEKNKSEIDLCLHSEIYKANINDELNEDTIKYMNEFKEHIIDGTKNILGTFGIEYQNKSNNDTEFDKKYMFIFTGNKPRTTFYFSNRTNEQLLDYIKTKKLRVRLSCNWTSSDQLCKDWNHMTHGSGQWVSNNDLPNIQFVSDNNDIDYYVVVNKTTEDIIPSKTIVFRMEPNIDDIPFYNDWLHDKPKSAFMYFMDHKCFRNNTEWWLSKSISDFSNFTIYKSSIFSAVVSSQYHSPGHIRRIDFVKYFQANSSIQLDIYGYDNNMNLKNYKGALPTRKKDNGIFPYKYILAVENDRIDNYFTEKIIDGILGECLCFYDGCDNITDFIDPNALIKLDLTNKEQSLKIVEDCINNNEWDKRIGIIRKEKQRIINKFNISARVSSLIYINNMDFYTFVKQEIPGIKLLFVNKDNVHVGYRNKELLEVCYKSNKPIGILEEKCPEHFLDNLSEILIQLNKDYDILILDNDVRGHDKKSTKIIKDDVPINYIIKPSGAKKILNDDIVGLNIY